MRGEFDCLVHYRIVRKIASGGMGDVYEARKFGVDGFEKRVAVKTILPQWSNDSRLVAMFIDEARLVADLVHENIVQIYQLGKCGDQYFMVMELVVGISLHDFIRLHVKENLSIPRELAVFIASRIARGLAYAHSRCGPDGKSLEIVHRDVCPNNILITTEGLPKLTDFGIARAVNTFTAANENAFMGKLPYMAPEQLRPGTPVDFRADIYALGLVLWELLALEKARAGKDAVEIRRSVLAGDLDWSRLPRDLDPDCRRILEKMLAPEPENRYDDASKLGRDLEYNIYREGYGPTVVTLEQYLRRYFPGLYRPAAAPGAAPKRSPESWAKTVALPAPPPAPQKRGETHRPPAADPPPKSGPQSRGPAEK